MLGGRGNKAGGSGRCTNAYCISVGVVPLCDRLELLILMLLLNKRFDESIFERRKLPTLLLVRASHVLGGIDRARCWPRSLSLLPRGTQVSRQPNLANWGPDTNRHLHSHCSRIRTIDLGA